MAIMQIGKDEVLVDPLQVVLFFSQIYPVQAKVGRLTNFYFRPDGLSDKPNDLEASLIGRRSVFYSILKSDL